MQFVAVLVTLVLFYVLYQMKKRGISFGGRVITGTIVGLILGFIFKDNTEYVSVFGSIYVNLLYAMVIPLLLTTIIRTMLNTGSLTKLRSVGLKSIGILSLHNVMGSIVGLILAVAFKIGQGVHFDVPVDSEVKEVPTVSETITNFFPSNIVSNAAEGQVVPIIIFSVLVGVATLKLIESGKEENVRPFAEFINSFAEVIFKLTSMITSLTPYAVLALMTNAVGRVDSTAIAPFILILVLNYVASVIHTFLGTGILVSSFAKVNPIAYFKKVWPVTMIGFTTQSSMGAIPANVENLTEKQGVAEEIASFTAPLGATMGMPGCAGFWPVMNAIFVANMMGLGWGAGDYIKLVLIALLVSLGTVGVPGTATITTTALFAAMGLPLEMVVLLAPISTLADMGRTATNVTAANSSALIVAASEDKLNREVFNRA
ncbi:dicarboxylate/amino acid:cation symporter [Anaerococcus octavius]|uniref:L-cystine uptake protein TcyP n=1 Tax=Anaerococcus octavius TaxID=54007 RepID=A0A2I1M3U6_9FIRM|nr:dicarboxylate/amino acid:cation symporter [Anaerococcus octavius]PKZ14784.1 dicarboxylate/amino acid:cation symporter [Anaerococcus octavius]